MNNAKLNVYKKVLQEVYEEFDGAKIKDKIEEIYSNEKLSVEKVTYLFMNDCDNFKVKTSCAKILQASFWVYRYYCSLLFTTAE